MRFKTVLALIVVVAPMSLLTIWVPSAPAIPAFARQTGFPCEACHFQHFPVLNAFGRAFKYGGFTMIGSQPKVEGSLGLSIPAVLNLNIEAYVNYVKTNGPTGLSTPTTQTTNNGQFQVPSSLSLFAAGRVNEHIGFEAEFSMYPTPAGLLNYKMPFVYDLGDFAKVGATIFTTSVYGPSFGLEVLNTGANGVHLFNQFDMPVISAQQYLNTGTPAVGVDWWVNNQYGFGVFGIYTPDNVQTFSSGTPSIFYGRLALTPPGLIPGGWDFGFGGQIWQGNGATTGNIPGTVGGPPGFILNPVAVPPINEPVAGTVDARAYAVDAQLLGVVYGMPLTVITSYGWAPSKGSPSGVVDGFQGNLYNQGTAMRKSWNMGIELGVIPNRLTLQQGVRIANSGFAIGSVNNATDNAWLSGLTFQLTQNVRTDITFSQYWGDLYYAGSKQIQIPIGPAGVYLGNNKFQAVLIAAF